MLCEWQTYILFLHFLHSLPPAMITLCAMHHLRGSWVEKGIATEALQMEQVQEIAPWHQKHLP